MSSIDEKTIRKTAHLARIEIDEANIPYYTDQIKGVVDWIEQLADVDTNGIEPMVSISEKPMPVREDVMTDGDYVEEVTQNAPESAYGFFVVPKVVE